MRTAISVLWLVAGLLFGASALDGVETSTYVAQAPPLFVLVFSPNLIAGSAMCLWGLHYRGDVLLPIIAQRVGTVLVAGGWAAYLAFFIIDGTLMPLQAATALAYIGIAVIWFRSATSYLGVLSHRAGVES